MGDRIRCKGLISESGIDEQRRKGIKDSAVVGKEERKERRSEKEREKKKRKEKKGERWDFKQLNIY